MLTRGRIARPTVLLHGGGGSDTPADRETRATRFDPSREERK